MKPSSRGRTTEGLDPVRDRRGAETGKLLAEGLAQHGHGRSLVEGGNGIFGVDDRVRAGISAQAAEEIVDTQLQHRGTGLDRRRADVRQHDRPRLGEQRLAGRRRLLFQDVERSTGEPAIRQSAAQRLLVDDSAPGGVQKECGRLHQAQPLGTDQVQGAGVEVDVQRNEVGSLKSPFKVELPLDAVDARQVVPAVPVADADLESQAPPRPPGRCGRTRRAGGPCLPCRCRAVPRSTSPARRPGGLGQPPCQHDHERHDEVGDGVGEHRRRGDRMPRSRARRGRCGRDRR